MPSRPQIVLVGPGKLGTSLALALRSAGYRVAEIVSRNRTSSRARARKLARLVGARAVTPRTADWKGSAVFLCVTDHAIARCADELARMGSWKGKRVFHCSGALSSELLAPLQRRGAAVASLHPMMTFVSAAPAALRGVSFALEGDPAAVALARRMVRDLGGHVLAVSPAAKTLYHAFGHFSSPQLVSLLAAAEAVAGAAGLRRFQVRRAMEPIVRQTLENYFRGGAAAAFSGPLARGNVETVRRHLRALRRLPRARAIYATLAAFALNQLPARNRPALA
ncbi:MAG: Rossmann-like and DUF2520 domain-containing protein, partial [Terriglobales bacterium]